jgi:hypothetical protein
MRQMIHQWKTAPALLVTLGIASSALAPITFSASATATPAPTQIAQLFPPDPYNQGGYNQGGYNQGGYNQGGYNQGGYNNTYYGSVAIPAGTRIPVRSPNNNKIIVAPDESMAVTLAVARNIRSTNGALLIPAGAQVRGTIQPAGNGSRFFAESLVFPDGSRAPLNATSAVVTRRQEIQPGVNGDALIKGSAVGAGAATILSGVLGNRRITIGKILAGAGAGALGGLVFGKKRAEVIVIDPNSDLNLTLNSQLVLNASRY